MKDRQIIIGLLRAVAARMRAARVLHEIGFAACVVLFALAAFELIRVPLGEAVTDAHRLVLLVGLILFSLYVLARALRRVTLDQAAGLVDARLPLRDEIKSAYWFASQPEQAEQTGAAFVKTHVANAARTAKTLRGSRVLPLRLPRTMLLALLPGIVLIAAIWSSPDLVRAGTAPVASSPQTVSDPQTVRALLAATASDQAEIKLLDQALATFERSDVTPQELQQAVSAARAAVDQVNMRASVAREGMATLVRAMRGNPQLQEVADALEEGRTGEAIAMLKKMRKDASQGGAESAAESDVAESTRTETPFDQMLGDMARDLAGMTSDINDDALNRLIANLDDVEKSMEMQRRVNETQSRAGGMTDVMLVNTQQGSLTAARFSSEFQAAMGSPSPYSGKSDMQGGTMFRQGMVAAGDNDQADDGSTTGSSSGHSAALALEGRATRRLDAQLKLETVRVDSDEDAEQKEGDASWLYSASQQEAAKSEFADVRERGSYESADVMRSSRVPMQQRQAVRDYFIKVHEGNEK